MTNAQTEARALWLAATREEICNDGDAISVIATALAAKDAELAVQREAKEHARRECDRAEAQLAEARKALEQIERKICAAEHGHTINDVLANYREVRRTVQDARAARRALEAQGGE